MNPDAETLTLIRTSFPDRGEFIEHTFRQNESFQSVCEDYRECIAVLERWKQRETAEAPLRRQEYAELLVELDQEIRIWLEELEKGDAPEADTDRE